MAQAELDRLYEYLDSYSDRKKFKIYQYAHSDRDPYMSPFDLDYKTGLMINLVPAMTMVQGELRQVTYYAVYDANEPVYINRFKEPVLEVKVDYHRDYLGFAQYRVVTRRWYYEDGTICNDMSMAKVTTKIYDFIGTIREGKRRRQNVIDNMMIPIMGMMLQTSVPHQFSGEAEVIREARRFMSVHKISMVSFIDDSNPQLSEEIATASEAWLNNVISADGTTIRMYLMNELNVQEVL
jgi:hypothetical protein